MGKVVTGRRYEACPVSRIQVTTGEDGCAPVFSLKDILGSAGLLDTLTGKLMTLKPHHLILGLCTAGLVSGYVAKSVSTRTGAPQAENAAVAGRAGPSTPRDPSSADPHGKAAAGSVSTKRSTDTLESLAALDGDALYARLALWLIDASEPEIAAYWTAVSDKPGRANDITDLIFINWTRLDPQAAIAAVAGTDSEHFAWWAWACHDPKAALAAAIAANPDRVISVAWGIGEFHPDWLREHFDQIPESARNTAMGGMTKWDDTDKPAEILDFLKQHGQGGQGFNARIFNTLVRKDPWAAYQWLQNNTATVTTNYGSAESVMQQLVKSMGETQPDALARLAAQTPSGEAKRKMEAVLFDNLLKNDPDAALEQASATEAPRVAALRLAAVGLSLLKADPDKALELTQKLFATCPDALDNMTWIRYSNNGTSGSGGRVQEVNDLLTGLMEQNPAKVLDAFLPDTQSGAALTSRDRFGFGKDPFSSLSSMWAEQDLAAYTTWVNQQGDPTIRDRAAGTVINKLLGQQHYAEAAEWAMSSENLQSATITNVVSNWVQSNPEAAATWLESAKLPADRKADLQRYLKAHQTEP